MSYRGAIGWFSGSFLPSFIRSCIRLCRVRDAHKPQKQKNESMNYEATKTAIDRLADETEANKGSRIRRELEPLREALVQARRKGVTLHRLHQLLKQQGFDYSPSAFGKYAQTHLQTGLCKPSAKPTKRHRVGKGGSRTTQERGGPRVASGSY